MRRYFSPTKHKYIFEVSMKIFCMKCQILFSGENKKNIYLSPAEIAQRVVKANQWIL